MYRSALLAAVLLALTLVDPARLGGQALPRTDVFEIEPPIPPVIMDEDYRVDCDHGELGALAVPGGFAMYWSTTCYDSRDIDSDVWMYGRFLDPDGRLGDYFKADLSPWYCWAYTPALARSATTEKLLFAWVEEDEFEGSYVWYELFDSVGLPLSAEIRAAGEDWDDYDEDPAVAGGREIFVIAWKSSNHSRTTQMAQVFRASDGEALSPPLHLDEFPGHPDSDVSGPAVGIDAKDRFVAVWPAQIETSPPVNRYALRGQRFNRNGKPLGERFTVAEEASWPPGAAMVMEPDGSFTVAWDDRIRQFHPDGTPSGPPVEISSSIWRPVLARDPHGNLALAGDSGVQLLNRHLVPQGPPMEWFESVAFDNSGHLLTVWTGPLEPDALDSILGRIWNVRRDADACAYRGKQFLCDTAGDGGSPDVAIPFGLGRKIDTPLLGDFDGDGRDDPCVYEERRFLCDTAHDGVLAEGWSPRFGWHGDVPLLGDLDGDGRDDPCVYHGGRFLCDADRNGKADRSIAFGLPGDLPVIGDVDGDRRDDPCVVREDRFLCDTARDGGDAEVELILEAAGSGTPALGDVDGDGSDDPCVFTAGRLVCGLFPKEGGLPNSIVDRAFGRPGDVLLLGDLDAF